MANRANSTFPAAPEFTSHALTSGDSGDFSRTALPGFAVTSSCGAAPILEPAITRRSFMKSLSVASAVAFGAPVAAMAVEDTTGKVDRLTQELSETLSDYCDGMFRAIVDPSSAPNSQVFLQNMRVGPGRKQLSSREDIARRVHELAGEMSSLLGRLDDGMWEVRVSPPCEGQPVFAVQQTDLPPLVRLEQGLTIAACAMNKLQPGRWRTGHNVKMGFAIITNDEWRGEQACTPKGV